jgi:hypothetical protein
MALWRAARPGVGFVLAALVAASASRAGAQAPADSGRPHKSVYGKLASVDRARNGIVMTSDAGETLGWQFNARVLAEAARFKPGDRMIVIYRQISDSDKRVTAVAFPGSATSPIYVNTTGSRVVVRSRAAVDGVCGATAGAQVTEVTIPSDGMAEVLDGCWCCAEPGETCVPGNKSGAGRALLVQCFQ